MSRLFLRDDKSFWAILEYWQDVQLETRPHLVPTGMVGFGNASGRTPPMNHNLQCPLKTKSTALHVLPSVVVRSRWYGPQL